MDTNHITKHIISHHTHHKNTSCIIPNNLVWQFRGKLSADQCNYNEFSCRITSNKQGHTDLSVFDNLWDITNHIIKHIIDQTFDDKRVWHRHQRALLANVHFIQLICDIKHQNTSYAITNIINHIIYILLFVIGNSVDGLRLGTVVSAMVRSDLTVDAMVCLDNTATHTHN